MQFQQIEFRQIGWRGTLGLILALALGLGIVVALAIVSLGVAILLLPVVAIAALVGWFRWKRIVAAARKEAAQQPGEQIIEIDYEVIDRGNGRDR